MKNRLCNVTNYTEHTNIQERVHLRVAEDDAKGMKNPLDGLDFRREVFTVRGLFRALTTETGVIATELKLRAEGGELVHHILFIHRIKRIASATKTVREGVDAAYARRRWKANESTQRGGRRAKA